MKDTFKFQLIEDFMKENNLSIKKFCETCKISYLVFNKIKNNKFNFKVNAIFKIVKVLKIQVHQLFNN